MAIDYWRYNRGKDWIYHPNEALMGRFILVYILLIGYNRGNKMILGVSFSVGYYAP
jgi:hypothetical protein